MQSLNTETTLILSSGEIYVLAGLLGYRSVFCVSDKLLREWKNGMKRYVQDTVDRLEKRMLILVDLGGNVNWEASTEAMIHALCRPELASRFTFTGTGGRKSASWLLYRSGQVLRVDRIAPDAYRLTLGGIPQEQELLEGIFREAAPCTLHERLPLTDAYRIRSELEAFDPDSARRILQGSLADPAAGEPILTALSGTNAFLRIQCRQLRKTYYRNVWEQLLVRSGSQVLRLSQEDDMVHFDAVKSAEIAGRYADVLKEGASWML